MIKKIKKWLFKEEKEIETIDNNVRESFSKVDNDIKHIVSWLNHLHEKHEITSKQMHNRHDESTIEIMKLGKWIEYLHQSEMKIQNECKNLRDEIADLKQSMSKKHIKTEIKANLEEAEIEITPDPSLNLKPSEKRVLTVLLNANKRLGYADIARIVQMDYGTVKNAMSGLRRKKISIDDEIGSNKAKKFFIKKKDLITAVSE